MEEEAAVGTKSQLMISLGGLSERGALHVQTYCFDQWQLLRQCRSPGRKHGHSDLSEDVLRTSVIEGFFMATWPCFFRHHHTHAGIYVSLSPHHPCPSLLLHSLHPLLCYPINFVIVRIHPSHPLSPPPSYLMSWAQSPLYPPCL